MKFLALDVGEKRIGLARGDSRVRIAVPAGFVETGGSEWQEIAQITNFYGITRIIVGLPRNNQGQETAQSAYVREFARQLMQKIPRIKVHFQDETLTSVVAEERLKQRGKPYEKGDIDAEAATIIMQDYLDSLKDGGSGGVGSASATKAPMDAETPVNAPEAAPEASGTAAAALGAVLADSAQDDAPGAPMNAQELSADLSADLANFQEDSPGVDAGAEMTATPVTPPEITPETAKSSKKKEKMSKKAAKKSKKSKGRIITGVISAILIVALIGVAGTIGFFYLRDQRRAERAEMYAAQEAEMAAETFDFTVKPGETIFDVRDNLIAAGYSETEVEKALDPSNYNFPMLKNLPADATLEGYLFAETKQFFQDTTATEVVEFFLENMQNTVDENNLEQAFAAQGLDLHEGITLASMVQKEAPTAEMPTVAQVFLSRLENGIMLGSDVTVSYALDVLYPDRGDHENNQAALTVDSCYNTRLYSGLPCGPISNPGLAALEAVANPSDTSYLYFLTGDDGLMYYSYTEDEHTQNATLHCQDLCQVSL